MYLINESGVWQRHGRQIDRERATGRGGEWSHISQDVLPSLRTFVFIGPTTTV